MRSALTAFARIPKRPRSTAYCRISATSAAFATAYGPKPGPGLNALLLALKRSAPPRPCAHHDRGRRARRRCCARARFSSSDGAAPLALFGVSRPPFRRRCRRSRRRCRGRRTLRSRRAARAPLRRVGDVGVDARDLEPRASLLCAASSASVAIERRTTCAPSREERAVALPMPDAAPVTSATRRASGSSAAFLSFACSRLQYSTSNRSPAHRRVRADPRSRRSMTWMVCS